jgi:hypothetical protein
MSRNNNPPPQDNDKDQPPPQQPAIQQPPRTQSQAQPQQPQTQQQANVVGVHYKIGRKIGEGSFGIIYEGLYLKIFIQWFVFVDLLNDM